MCEERRDGSIFLGVKIQKTTPKKHRLKKRILLSFLGREEIGEKIDFFPFFFSLELCKNKKEREKPRNNF
jgi:hypothetical protein